ncbi:MAG: anti-sigma factor family protein [Planctomycetota bacterium]
MPEGFDHSDDQLDRYLDGLLTEPERAEFEARLREDESLRTAAEVQRRIDRTLRRCFQPPASGACNETTPARVTVNGHAAIGEPPTITSTRRPWFARRWALAAALLLGVLGVWQIFTVLMPGKVGPLYGDPVTFDGYYQGTVATGFEPDWVCETDEEFQQTFEKHYDQSLLLAELPPGSAAIGLSYCHSMSPATTCLLARVGGEPVIVFVDRLERDPGSAEWAGPGMNLFRRQLAKVVLYELTPLDRPTLLEHFYAP